MQCFNAPRASAFDYNLLEPLQKLLRLSSPVAASLARPDMFTGILQKLNNKKAVVRLNLLRIVRSICDPSEEISDSIWSHSLFEAVQRLAETDNAVLVRNMASELVKAHLEKEQEIASGGRPQSSRRNNSYTPPSIHQSASAPMTPTHGSRPSTSSAFIDGSVTPRRMAVPSSYGEALHYRPKSRESLQGMMRRTSAELANETSGSKNRLPRASAHRPTHSSHGIATPGLRDDPSSLQRESGMRIRDEASSLQRESGMRLRDESRSAASPASGGTAPQLNPRRRMRPPSGDINWS